MTGILLALLSGMGLAAALRSKEEPALSLLTFSAGIGLGIGVLSCFYFGFIGIAGSAGPSYAMLDAIVCGAVAMLGFRLSRRRGAAFPMNELPPRSMLLTILNVLLIVNLLGVIGALITQYVMYPHGNWDAMAIWNYHARVLFASSQHWRENYHELPMQAHGNYPLLLPAFIARGWQFQGTDSTSVPAIVASLFTLGSAGLLYSFLKRLADGSAAALATLILLGCWTFVWRGSTQYADIPVAYFELGALGWLCLAEVTASSGPLVLAGMFAAFAAWTKNDALPFLAAMIAVHALATWRVDGPRVMLRKTALVVAGAAPVVLAIVYFKTAIAPPNWITEQGVRFEQLTDVSRHATVLKAFASRLLRIPPAWTPPLLLLLYPLLAGVRLPQRCRASALTALLMLPLMLCIFYGVYLITPTDLAWQLEHSIDRLLMQLFPALLFVIFLFSRSPEEVFKS